MVPAQGHADKARMSAFLYVCPHTGQQVQGWSSAEAAAPGAVEAVRCLACGRMHLIDPKQDSISKPAGRAGSPPQAR